MVKYNQFIEDNFKARIVHCSYISLNAAPPLRVYRFHQQYKFLIIPTKRCVKFVYKRY